MVLTSSTLMEKEVSHPLMSLVIWPTRMELAWQSLVTIVKIERWLMDMKRREVMLEMFTIPEEVLHNWLALQLSLPTASSLSSTNAVALFFSTPWATHIAGGCHATAATWRTGVEPHQLIPTSVHAEWHLQTRVPTLTEDATATRMMEYGVRTAVCSLKSLTFPCCSLGLEILVCPKKQATTRLANSNVTVLPKFGTQRQCVSTHFKHHGFGDI